MLVSWASLCLSTFLPAIDIVVPLKDVTTIEGTKAVLEAKISAQDISSVKWYHNDKLLAPTDRIQMVAKGAKQRLVFTRTFASDEGHYKLAVGKVDTSCNLSVESMCLFLLQDASSYKLQLSVLTTLLLSQRFKL